MKCCYLLSLLLLISVSVFGSDEDQLAYIDEIRLEDYQRAKHLLTELDKSALTPQQQELHDYLSVYLSTFDGNIRQTYQGYATLLKRVTSSDVKIRILVSRIGLAGYIGEWTDGFETANTLHQYLNNGLTHQQRKDAFNALITFYTNAGQHQLAYQLIDEAKPLAQDDPLFQCGLSYHELEAQFDDNPGQLAPSQALQIQQQCDEAGSQFYALYVHTYYFYLLVVQQQHEQALAALALLKPQVEAQSFLYLKVAFWAYESQYYLQTAQPDNAVDAAKRVINEDPRREFISADIMALEVLAKVTEQSGQFEASIAYLKQLDKLRAALREEKIIKASAYQQVMFEVQLKEKEIALLNEHNRYLQTQSQLAQQRVRSSYAALTLIGIILIGVLVWAYRSTKLQQKLTTMARVDSLTGISNRGYFLDRVNRHLNKARQHNLPCSLLLLDLDFFKQVNDTYGHQVGDWVLERTVSVIRNLLEEGMEFGRMGGEEFAIFIRNANRHRAVVIAEQCRQAINGVKTDDSGHQFSITASFGVSDTEQVGYAYQNLSAASDLALYQSKQYGRNRVYEYETGLVGEFDESDTGPDSPGSGR